MKYIILPILLIIASIFAILIDIIITIGYLLWNFKLPSLDYYGVFYYTNKQKKYYKSNLHYLWSIN